MVAKGGDDEEEVLEDAAGIVLARADEIVVVELAAAAFMVENRAVIDENDGPNLDDTAETRWCWRGKRKALPTSSSCKTTSNHSVVTTTERCGRGIVIKIFLNPPMFNDLLETTHQINESNVVRKGQTTESALSEVGKDE